jgi:hypothetical protein
MRVAATGFPYGFVACRTRTFDHLPFTVCFLEKPVVGHQAR